MKIIIDSGHGGSDPGAIAFDTLEKDLNLIYSQLLSSKLQDAGYEVDTSIIDDINYDSTELTDIIKNSGAALCISCHNNSFNGLARGLEIIHSIYSDGTLASYILSEVENTGYIIRSAYSKESTVNPGSDYYFIIRQTYPDVETIIMEFGFMDNAQDYSLLTSSDWQDKLTTAVVEGVKKYSPVQSEEKTPIIGTSLLKPIQLKNALQNNNSSADTSIVDVYFNIAELYGIKADLAFLQAVKETNWLKFTGVVKAQQNNFAGLGATDSSNSGESFSSVEIGVEAHIQHLYAYCTTAQLPVGRPVYDTRFNYVQRGIAPNWEDLNGRWAVPGVDYGESIINIQKFIAENYPVDETPESSSEDDTSTEDHWAKPCNDELLEAGILYSDHSETLDQAASEGMVLCLINRIRKERLSPEQSNTSSESGASDVHWAKQCNDELLDAGILYNDHSETLDQPASEGMLLCLVNRLRKELSNYE